jgi:hypothetical protein
MLSPTTSRERRSTGTVIERWATTPGARSCTSALRSERSVVSRRRRGVPEDGERSTSTGADEARTTCCAVVPSSAPPAPRAAWRPPPPDPPVRLGRRLGARSRAAPRTRGTRPARSRTAAARRPPATRAPDRQSGRSFPGKPSASPRMTPVPRANRMRAQRAGWRRPLPSARPRCGARDPHRSFFRHTLHQRSDGARHRASGVRVRGRVARESSPGARGPAHNLGHSAAGVCSAPLRPCVRWISTPTGTKNLAPLRSGAARGASASVREQDVRTVIASLCSPPLTSWAFRQNIHTFPGGP